MKPARTIPHAAPRAAAAADKSPPRSVAATPPREPGLKPVGTVFARVLMKVKHG